MTKLDIMANSRDAVDSNNNNNKTNNNDRTREPSNLPGSKAPGGGGGCAGKYLLRPRSVRSLRRCDSAEWSITETRRQKSRPAPLSKYRRKTANTRERCRMRQINTAFEKLRKMLPSWEATPVPSSSTSSEMTKITTLKYACAYIQSLQDILDNSVSQNPGEEVGCSWVFSTMLDNTSLQSSPQDVCLSPPDTTSPSLEVRPQHDTDLMDLLCDSSDSGVFDEGLDSFSYLSPMCEADEVALLLLGADTGYWHDPTNTQFVAV